MKSLQERLADFRRLTGVELPIMNAPMAGVTTPEMVAAVSDAGGLGVLAADFLDADEITRAVARVREKTDKPFAVNLRVPVFEKNVDITPLTQALQALREELGCPETIELPDFDAQFEAVLDASVPVVRVAFGGFREIYAGAATTLREAKVQRAAGADAVVVQGAEAGGPRLSFESRDEDLVGLMSLIGPAGRATRLPIIASGGIASAFQMAASLVAGAYAVEVGTYLVRTRQSTLSKAYDSALEFACDTDARLTRLISGRLTRALPGALFQALKEADIAALSYPAQLTALLPIYRAALEKERYDLVPLSCGQSIPARVPEETADAVTLLCKECRDLLQEAL